jgi:hypothetical protein
MKCAAILPGGGTVTFDLEKVDENGWIAKSPVFGKTTFHRATFSRVEFQQDFEAGLPLRSSVKP